MSVAATPAQLAAFRDGDPAERVALLRLVRVAEHFDPEYQRGLSHRERGLARAGLIAACPPGLIAACPLLGSSGHSRDGLARSLAGDPAGETS